MILAIDAGNTQTVLGLFEGKSLRQVWRVPSTSSSLRRWKLSLSKKRTSRPPMNGKVTAVLISSVVPSLREDLLALAQKVSDKKPSFISSRSSLPLRLKLKKPETVGADRIVNAVGALAQWKKDLLIIDFGTATTFDLVTKKGEFLGGVIVPGLQTMNRSLASACSQLPEISLTPFPKRVVGQNTKEAIRSGIFFGSLGLVEGMIRKFEKEFGHPLFVVITGGWAPRLGPYLAEAIHAVDPHLTLKGLQELGA